MLIVFFERSRHRYVISLCLLRFKKNIVNCRKQEFLSFLYFKKNNQLHIKGVNLNPTFWLYIKKKPSVFVTSTEYLATFDVSPFSFIHEARWIIKTGRLAKHKKIFPYELPAPAHDSLGDTLLQDCPYGKCAWSSETIDLVQTWAVAISGWQLSLPYKHECYVWGRQEWQKGGI